MCHLASGKGIIICCLQWLQATAASLAMQLYTDPALRASTSAAACVDPHMILCLARCFYCLLLFVLLVFFICLCKAVDRLTFVFLSFSARQWAVSFVHLYPLQGNAQTLSESQSLNTASCRRSVKLDLPLHAAFCHRQTYYLGSSCMCCCKCTMHCRVCSLSIFVCAK